MAKKEKQLLLIDISARLPYGVKFYVDNTIPPIPSAEDYRLGEVHNVLTATGLDIESDCIYTEETGMDCTLKILTPYLRSMSSMTESEASDMFNVMYPKHELINVEIEKDRVRFGNKDKDGKYHHITLFFNKIYSLEQLDWLNAYHFDYRGLIPMGLALEAKEDMYKTNN